MSELHLPVKIQPRHLDRLAIVYVRQSHPQQQIKHPESVATQRRLRERIEQWGWPSDRIRVLDGDLGKSGTSTVGRDDFAWLVSEVTLNHVGLVAGFQINRLAREDETICHLIKICSLFDTLLADQDGLYHPQDFNDRLVLTIKGLVGGVELHQIQQRMQQARLERARRGEWLGAKPIGYVLGSDRKLALDPDEQVQQAVRQVFEQFEQLGAVSAVLRYFQRHDMRLPLREQTLASTNRVVWRRAQRETIRNLLRHPAYAGAFTWGRRRIEPRRAVPGHRGTGRIVLAPRDCAVFLPDNHAAYISWETFERNVQRLSSQRRRGPEPSEKREVVSLLAGRVICGRCGSRMQGHYSPRLRYECARRALDYGESACASLPGEEIERLAGEQILLAMEPASLELSLSACQRLESERAALDRSWQLCLERAEYEAQRAFRQYDTVEPENRLVARNLERQWEAALQTVRGLQEDYDRFKATRPTAMSAAERKSVMELSTNLPRLWKMASVADKRRVVQLLVEKVVVGSTGNEVMTIEMHWAGGTATHHETNRRVHRWKDLSGYDAMMREIRKLGSIGRSSREIADHLNAAGYRTCRGTVVTAESVRQLRFRDAAARGTR